MTDVPTNMTELGGNIHVLGNSRIFEIRKMWKKDMNQGDSVEGELKLGGELIKPEI